MKNSKITDQNQALYKKLLSIKEGKSVSNSKCVYIPAFLLAVEAIFFVFIIPGNPILAAYMPSFFSTLIEASIFGVVLYAVTKANIKLSKVMSLSYFKKEYPNIDTDISVKELKQELNKYRMEKYPDSYEREKKYNTYMNSKSTSVTKKEKIAALEKEKEFLLGFKKNKKEEKATQKKKKF